MIAVGYTLVYGVLRLINFAHGDVFMVGAMSAYYLQNRIIRAASHATPPAIVLWIFHPPADSTWLGFLLVLLASMLICGVVGFLIEFIAYRPLRDQPRIISLITAIGVSMLFEYGGQQPWAFGPDFKAFPPLIPGIEKARDLLSIGGVVIGKIDAIIFGTTMVAMVGLWFVVQHTRLGLALRAVSFRFDTASLMGINVNRIISFTFVLGSMLAAIAGVLVGIHSNKAYPLMGLMMGLKAFIAAVLGGIGSIPGAVAGGMLLGLTEVMVKGYFPHGSQYTDAVAFVFLITVLMVKPSGLFGRHAIEKV